VEITCGGPTATEKEATTAQPATGRNESMSSEEWNKRHPERMREAQRRFKEAHPNYFLEYQRKYQPKWREKNKERVRQISRNFLRRHPNKNKKRPKPTVLQQQAWQFIHANPHLVGSQCEFCGETEDLVGHHPDYHYPKIIVTCCSSCHMYIHKGVKN